MCWSSQKKGSHAKGAWSEKHSGEFGNRICNAELDRFDNWDWDKAVEQHCFTNQFLMLLMEETRVEVLDGFAALGLWIGGFRLPLALSSMRKMKAWWSYFGTRFSLTGQDRLYQTGHSNSVHDQLKMLVIWSCWLQREVILVSELEVASLIGRRNRQGIEAGQAV